jgi:hypothetical protein
MHADKLWLTGARLDIHEFFWCHRSQQRLSQFVNIHNWAVIALAINAVRERAAAAGAPDSCRPRVALGLPLGQAAHLGPLDTHGLLL